MPKILITGGCGFVGHHFVEHFLKTTDWSISILDKLSYAANGFDRIRDIGAYDDSRLSLYTYDLENEISQGITKENSTTEYILHLAAESHVDGSIKDPMKFVRSNVVGTGNILEFARRCKNLKAFVMFSTDEVFGPAPAGIRFKESDPYNCTNPYSATKAGAEQLTLAYMNTYNVPGFITHTMNVFGERQHPEKFIPMCIKRILGGEKIFIHADKQLEKPGSRFYIHARNVANAVHFLLGRFEQREMYNIVGEQEVDNLTLVKFIASLLRKSPVWEPVDFHSSRPGHDLRYALDGSKMKGLGWRLPLDFKQSLSKTIEWYINNPRWLDV